MDIFQQCIDGLKKFGKTILSSGSKLFQRARSVEVVSKTKKQIKDKKSLSVDSKQKKQNIKNPEKESSIQIIEASVQEKQLPFARPLNKKQTQLEQNKNTELSSQMNQNLLQGLGQDLQTIPDTVFKKEDLPRRKQIIPNTTNQVLLASNVKMNSKICIRKDISVQKKRVQEICAVCKELVGRTGSLMLACTHRFHKTCAIKMQHNMRYNCDLCSHRNCQESRKLHK